MERRKTHIDEYFVIYYREMYFVAKQIVRDHYFAEDVVQESFVKAYKCQEMLQDIRKVRAWLRTIVTRTAIDFLRKISKCSYTSLEQMYEESQQAPEHTNSVEQQSELHFQYKEIHACVKQLPTNLQEVINLKLTNDCSDAEIARQLQISLSAVKTRLHRARKKLKHMYKHEQS